MPATALREHPRPCDAPTALAFRLQRQRLDQRSPEALPALVAGVGYVPCPGGTTPYLALHARSPRLERRPAELAAFERGGAVEVPCARRSLVIEPAFDALREPVPGRPAFVPFRDPAVSATKDLKPMLPPDHGSRKLADWRGRYAPAGGGGGVPQRFLLEGGLIRGVWEHEPDERRVRHAIREPLATRARRRADQAAEELGAYIQGDSSGVQLYEDDRADALGRVADTCARW